MGTTASNFTKVNGLEVVDSNLGVTNSKDQSDAFFQTLLFAQPCGLKDEQQELEAYTRRNVTALRK